MRMYFKTTARTHIAHRVVWLVMGGLGLLAFASCTGTTRNDDDRRDSDSDVDDPSVDPPEVELPSECKDVPLSAGTALVRRLTHQELRNTVRDVLNVDLGDHHNLPGLQEPGAGLFSNDSVTVLKVDSPQVTGYSQIAAEVSRKVTDWQALASKFTNCARFENKCVDDFLRHLGLRMFRRPLSDAEVKRYGGLFELAKNKGDNFGVGANLTVQAMLQSPNFLYRVEAETPKDQPLRRLNSYELASRLSYLIWGSSPDDALYEDAESDRLTERDVLTSQVQRLLSDQKADDIFVTFISDWLALHELEGLAFDPEYYGSASEDTVKDMLAETHTFARGLWSNSYPVSSLFTAQHTTASEKLARSYGFDAKPGVQAYDLSDRDDRAGILTQGAFLGLHGQASRASNQPEPSLVERGKFILQNVFCSSVPPPPDDVVNSALIKTNGKSERGLAEDRAKTPRCRSCHSSIDPFGLAFVPYDNFGRKRTKDVYGNEVRGDGLLVHPITGEQSSYSNVQQFAATLAKDPHVRRCMVQKGLQFAMGKRLQPIEDPSQACFIDSVNGRITNDNASFKDVFGSIAGHPLFSVVGRSE